MQSAEGGTRTLTPLSELRILSPLRLPFRHPGDLLNALNLQQFLDAVRRAVELLGDHRIRPNESRLARPGASMPVVPVSIGFLERAAQRGAVCARPCPEELNASLAQLLDALFSQ